MERYLTERQYQKHTHKQGYTQTHMNELDRIVLERKSDVATPEERRYYRDQYPVVQTNQVDDSNTVKTKEHREYKHLVQWKKGKLDQSSQNIGYRGHQGHGHLQDDLPAGIILIIAPMTTVTIISLI